MKEIRKPFIEIKPVLNDDKSHTGYFITEDCKLYNGKDWENNIPFLDSEKNLSFYSIDNRPFGYIKKEEGDITTKKCYSLTRVVLQTFDDEFHPESYYRGLVADHKKSSIPLDNNKNNLQWLTHGDNHAKGNDLRPSQRHRNENNAKIVCELLSKGKSRKEIMQELEVTGQFIDDIKTGRTYRQISEKYTDKGFTYKTFDKEDQISKVISVCELLEAGERICNIIKIVKNINYNFVSAIKMRKTFTEISKNYNF